MPPAPTVASLGTQIRMAVVQETTFGVTPSWSGSSYGMIPAGETIARQGRILERNGLRGTRSHVADDARQGPYSVAGALQLEPTPDDLVFLLPWILGGSPTGTTYPLADTLPSFSLQIDRIAGVFTYAGCKVRRATFRGAKGGKVNLSLELAAQSETAGAAGSFALPAVAASQVKGPYILGGDTSLVLNGVAREVAEFELVIDNGLVTDRFMNNLTVVSLPENDRQIALHTSHAYASQNVDLYNQALAGAAGTLILTNGGSSTAFSFGTLQVPAQSPTASSRAEIMLRLEMAARKTGSTLELTVVHSP